MIAVQQKFGVEQLCTQADKLLCTGDPGQAVALYATAFKDHAGDTVSHIRKLRRNRLMVVISTLEAWLDGEPKLDGLNEGPSKTSAAALLSTLSPQNLSASLFRMESVQLVSGKGFEEVIECCSALLEGNEAPLFEDYRRMTIELTRALAFLLMEPHEPKGLHLYMKAFQENRLDTIKIVKGRQAQHLPKIVSTFLKQMTKRSHILHKANTRTDGLNLDADLECLEFLEAVSPRDVRVWQLRAAVLFCACRFEESAKAYATALRECDAEQESSAEEEKTSFWLTLTERRAQLLVGRAAAYFSLGGRAAEASRDLGTAFEIHPATARQQFHELFSQHGMGEVACTEVRQEAERGLSQYKEAVLARPDLRSTHGVEQLDPVIAQLQALCHLEPNGGGRELRVRLADCLLLRGEVKEALSVCSQLASASPTQQSYQNTVQVLRGYARLLSGNHQGAMEDFQAVIEHSAPHPSSCVRALCGRGLLRMLRGSHYLTALDYMTASRLQLPEAALAVRCFVPWNCRGLLCTVLLEQGRTMIEQAYFLPSTPPNTPPSAPGTARTPQGVHALAVLLMELDPDAESARILAADALYCQRRAEEAYRLLLPVGHVPARSPVLARLTLLQLHRGFLYDANQLLKKLIHCGDTSCLQTLLAVASSEDRDLLRRQCHVAAQRITDAEQGESCLRQAVAYLSIAIMSSALFRLGVAPLAGGEAADSLLARARCYALLGQHKTAIFDFNAILREDSQNVQALCGRGFTHLMLNQRKVDLAQEILFVKDGARKRICDWLHQHCRTSLFGTVSATWVPCAEEHLKEIFLTGEVLLKVDGGEPRWHLLFVDTLISKGETFDAHAHLSQIFGRETRDAHAQARWGVVEAWRRNFQAAAKGLSGIAEGDPSDLDLLLGLIQVALRKSLAQAAAHEADRLSLLGQWEPALALLTVAVRAAGDGKLLYRRRRAACLARLGQHGRAAKDLDRVVLGDKDPEVLTEDLCHRGHSLLLCSREEDGLEDFARALDTHPGRARRCVEDVLGVATLADRFLRAALRRVEEQQLGAAWHLVESGLKLHSSHAELRRLRARIKRDCASSCIVH
ncbi:Tetratricopeptide repeat protein 34-like [Arapaima gigas]